MGWMEMMSWMETMGWIRTLGWMEMMGWMRMLGWMETMIWVGTRTMVHTMAEKNEAKKLLMSSNFGPSEVVTHDDHIYCRVYIVIHCTVM